MSQIRVVDIANIGLEVEKADFEHLGKVGQELSEAFEEIGFVFVKNHGIEESIIKTARESSKEYFQLDASVKLLNEQGKGSNANQGWVKPGKEIFDQDEKGLIASLELRESYNINDFSSQGFFPDEEVPSFRPSLTRLGNKARSLGLRILKCLSVALGKDQDFFGDMHKPKDSMTLRTIYYPPVPENLAYKEGLVRLGEHSDYGTCTLLFQDDIGGLEVKNAAGNWISATPIPGTVLINIGDFLEIMTSGSWPATHHRVGVPEEEWRRSTSRQSMVMFVDPDPEVVIHPLAGPSEKYPAVKAGEYINTRRSQTYK